MIKEFLLVVFVMVIVFGFFLSGLDNAIRNIDIDIDRTIGVYGNEDTGYSVTFEEMGVPFFFGPSSVKLTLTNENGKKIDEIQTSISNDGSRLYRENATVIWKDREVDITLHGCEQEDETYTMAY